MSNLADGLFCLADLRLTLGDEVADRRSRQLPR
jgi:hypothetical protein